MDASFTSDERALIRREFTERFGNRPRLADGILLHRWATGQRKGLPKINTTVRGLIDRGLVEVQDDGGPWVRAFFTPLGYLALHQMAQNPVFLPSDRFDHLLQEINRRFTND